MTTVRPLKLNNSNPLDSKAEREQLQSQAAEWKRFQEYKKKKGIDPRPNSVEEGEHWRAMLKEEREKTKTPFVRDKKLERRQKAAYDKAQKQGSSGPDQYTRDDKGRFA